MSDIDITLYLNADRVRALAEALGDQTAETVEDKLAEAFDTLYQEYVPDGQRASIEATIEREDAAERARLEADRRFAVYHIRENGEDQHFTSDYFRTPLQAAYRYRLYECGELSSNPETFADAFIETNPVYLRKDIKEIINSIVDELGKDERIAALYDLWYESKETALKVYTESRPERLPLSQNKEFKSVKNMVIAEAMKLNLPTDEIEDTDEPTEPDREPTVEETESPDPPPPPMDEYERTVADADKGNKWSQYRAAKFIFILPPSMAINTQHSSSTAFVSTETGRQHLPLSACSDTWLVSPKTAWRMSAEAEKTASTASCGEKSRRKNRLTDSNNSTGRLRIHFMRNLLFERRNSCGLVCLLCRHIGRDHRQGLYRSVCGCKHCAYLKGNDEKSRAKPGHDGRLDRSHHAR